MIKHDKERFTKMDGTVAMDIFRQRRPEMAWFCHLTAHRHLSGKIASVRSQVKKST